MKQLFITAALLLTANLASATVDAAKAWKDGNAFIDKAQAEGKMETLLNPNICVFSDGSVGLIYSDDFRHLDVVFFNTPHLGLVKSARSQYKIEEVAGSDKMVDDLRQYSVTVDTKVTLTCVQSTMVLESVHFN